MRRVRPQASLRSHRTCLKRNPAASGKLAAHNMHDHKIDCAERAQTSASASNLNQKVIRDLNPDFRINPNSDLDVCQNVVD